MRQWRWIAAPMVAFALTACGGSGGDSGLSTSPSNNTPPTGGSTNPNTVTLQSSSFSPATINVAKGTTVTWQWPACDDSGAGGYGYSGSCVTHQVVFDDGSNTTSDTQSQGSFNRQFATAGTFKYHCSVHGAAVMSGQVIVQ
jgi:plastocyanin